MTKHAPNLKGPGMKFCENGLIKCKQTADYFALDLEYYADRNNRKHCYRLLWSNRFASETMSRRLVRHEGGVIRTGLTSKTLSALSDALATVRKSRSARTAAA